MSSSSTTTSVAKALSWLGVVLSWLMGVVSDVPFDDFVVPEISLITRREEPGFRGLRTVGASDPDKLPCDKVLSWLGVVLSWLMGVSDFAFDDFVPEISEFCGLRTVDACDSDELPCEAGPTPCSSCGEFRTFGKLKCGETLGLEFTHSWILCLHKVIEVAKTTTIKTSAQNKPTNTPMLTQLEMVPRSGNQQQLYDPGELEHVVSSLHPPLLDAHSLTSLHCVPEPS